MAVEPAVKRVTAAEMDRMNAQSQLGRAVRDYGEACRLKGQGDVNEPYVEDKRAAVKQATLRLIEAARVEGASIT